MTIRFLRNKVVDVAPQSNGSLAVSWRMTDDLLKADITMMVQPPDLEITEAVAELGRLVPRAWSTAPELIKRIEGVRVGSGLRKIVKGLLEGPRGCPILAQAVLESANAVILHYTRPGLQAGEHLADDDKLNFLRDLVRNSPRLARSCVAFQDDSPIMKEL